MFGRNNDVGDDRERYEMQQLDFEDDYISEFMANRRSYREEVRSVKNYLDQIGYEEHILFLAINKMHQIRANNPGIRLSVRNMVKRRVGLYEEALECFRNEYEILHRFFLFYKRLKDKTRALSVAEHLIEHHANKEDLWIEIAAWYNEQETKEDKLKARQVYMQGIEIHEEGKLLYKEAIHFELLIKQEALKSDPVDENAVKLCDEQIKFYTTKILEHIQGECRYYFDIVKVLESFDFTAELKCDFIKQIIEKYGNHLEVWKYLVERERKELYHEESPGDISSRERAKRIIVLYEQALERVSPHEKTELWFLYLEFSLSLLTLQNKEEFVVLNEKFEQAEKEKHLCIKGFLLWLRLIEINVFPDFYKKRLDNMMDTDEPNTASFKYMKGRNMQEICEKAVSCYPQSIDLWRIYLFEAIATQQGNTEEIFRRGINALKDKSKLLWVAYLQYCSVALKKDLMENLYKEACAQEEQISMDMKSAYLEWAFINFGITKAREVYDELIKQAPLLKRLHLMMQRFEFAQPVSDLMRWEYSYQCATNQYPHDPVMQSNYIKFLVQDKKANSSEVKQKYTTVLNILPELDRDTFKRLCREFDVSFD